MLRWQTLRWLQGRSSLSPRPITSKMLFRGVPRRLHAGVDHIQLSQQRSFRWVRGAPEDFDRWAEEYGCEGWSFKDVPWFSWVRLHTFCAWLWLCVAASFLLKLHALLEITEDHPYPPMARTKVYGKPPTVMSFYLSILWSYTSSKATVSDTSNIPPSDVGRPSGLHVYLAAEQWKLIANQTAFLRNLVEWSQRAPTQKTWEDRSILRASISAPQTWQDVGSLQLLSRVPN